jgi:Ca2+-binding RTX toxin-like protein
MPRRLRARHGVEVYTAKFTYSDGVNGRQPLVITLNVTDPKNNVINGTAAADILDGAAGNDVLKGFSGRDVLIGNIGNDRLDGGRNIDTLQGGKGDDVYYVNHASDNVIETGRNGKDTVIASTTYALKAGTAVEFMQAGTPGSTSAINLTGNEIANTLQGNAAANRLDGGDGADVMRGYRGNDTYLVDHRLDRVIDNAGRDTVVTAVSFVLTANSGVETLRTSDASGTAPINLTGNQLANTLLGNRGANRLDGGRAADVMQGYRGNDTLFRQSRPRQGDRDGWSGAGHRHHKREL